MRKDLLWGSVGLLLATLLWPCLRTVAQPIAPDTPVNIISDHIHRQGYFCDELRHAEREAHASRPHETVWILKCQGITYRVTLIADMAARVELVPG
jgi:hypothetical protein